MEFAGIQRELFRARSSPRAAGKCLFGLLAVACAFTPPACIAQPPSNFNESDVEAAYLYNFGHFIHWPPHAIPGQFAICMLGDGGFEDTLKSLVANESIDGHGIVARRIASAAAAGDCQIVFLQNSEEPRLDKDLAALGKKPVLTVSSLPGFLPRGGMIQFVLQNNKVRFAVNLAAAEQAGLSLSSELLRVALRVDTHSTEGVKQ